MKFGSLLKASTAIIDRVMTMPDRPPNYRLANRPKDLRKGKKRVLTKNTPINPSNVGSKMNAANRRGRLFRGHRP